MTESQNVKHNIPLLDLRNYIVDFGVLDLFDRKIAERLLALPLYMANGALAVAMAHPDNILAIDEIKLLSNCNNIIAMPCEEKDVMKCIDYNYSFKKPLADVIGSGREQDDDKLIRHMISEALKMGSSDICIRSERDELRLDFKIDGVWHTIVIFPKIPYLSVIEKIKDLAANNDTCPDIGRCIINAGVKEIETRIAVFFQDHGEKIEMRFVDKDRVPDKIENMGFSEENEKALIKHINADHGIIFVSGPGDYARINTLYSLLGKIASPEKKILTIENPILHTIRHVNQAQIDEKIGFSYAEALRSFLRHDSDVIMIDKIKDMETAELAFRASMSGHLIIAAVYQSGMHNLLARLKDLGVDPNMLSSCVICVLRQSFVRLICRSCKVEYTPDEVIMQNFKNDFPPDMKFYKGRGCPDCNNIGYCGTIGLFELIEFTGPIRSKVRDGAAMNTVRNMAIEAGMSSLRQDGIDKVKRQITTVEELVRALKT